MFNLFSSNYRDNIKNLNNELIDFEKTINEEGKIEQLKITNLITKVLSKNLKSEDREYFLISIKKIVEKYNLLDPQSFFSLDTQIDKVNLLMKKKVLRGVVDFNSPESLFLKSLNLRTFANLVGDVFLTEMKLTTENRLANLGIMGDPLEGLEIQEAIRFFLSSLDYLFLLKPEAFTPEDRLKLHKIKMELSEAIFWKDKFDTCRMSSKKKESFNKLKQELKEKIATLRIGQSITLPLGWYDKSRNSGHIIFLECEKTLNGLDITIYNTGDGSHFHENYVSDYKNYHDTICKYKVSAENMPKFLLRTLPNLLELNILSAWDSELENTNTYTSNDFYYHLRDYPQIVHQPYNIKSQLSGRCTIKAQLAYVGNKTSKETQKKIKKLWIYLCLETLSNHLDLLTDEPVFQENYFKIISRTIPLLFRKLHDEFKNENPLSKHQQEEIQYLLNLEDKFKAFSPISLSKHQPLPIDFSAWNPLKTELQSMIETADNTDLYSEASSEAGDELERNDFKIFTASDAVNGTPEEIFAIIQSFDMESYDFAYNQLSLAEVHAFKDVFVYDFFIDLGQILIAPSQELFKEKFLASLSSLSEEKCLTLLTIIERISSNYFEIEKRGGASTLKPTTTLFQYSCFALGKEIALILDRKQNLEGNGALENYNFLFEEFHQIKNLYNLPMQMTRKLEKSYENFLSYLESAPAHKKILIHIKNNEIKLKEDSGDDLYTTHFAEKIEDWSLADKEIQEKKRSAVDLDKARKLWLYCYGLPEQFSLLRKLYIKARLSSLGMGESSYNNFYDREFNPQFQRYRIPVDFTFGIDTSFIEEGLNENHCLHELQGEQRELGLLSYPKKGLQFGMLLDYYRSNPDRLSERMHQIIFSNILFAPFQLAIALKKFPELKNDIYRFFEEQLLYFNLHAQALLQDQRVQTIIFLLTMKQRTLQWLLDEDPLEKNQQTIKMRNQLKDCLKHPDFEDPLINLTLRLAYLETLCLSDELNEKVLSEAIPILLSIDPFLSSEDSDEGATPFNTLAYSYQIGTQALRDHHTTIQTFLEDTALRNRLFNEVLHFHKISTNEADWKLVFFPFYETKLDTNRYTLQPLSGAVLWKNGELLIERSDKEDIYQSYEYRKLFGSEKINLRLIENDFFEGMDAQGVPHRFKYENYHVTISKQILGSWYSQDYFSLFSAYTIWKELGNAPVGYIVMDKNAEKAFFKIHPSGLVSPAWDLEHTYALSETYSLSFFPSQSFLFLPSDENDVPFLLFPHEKDEEGDFLIFQKQGNKWIWKKDPQFFVSQDQQIFGLNNFESFIMLENKNGAQEVLLKDPSEKRLIRCQAVKNKLSIQFSTEKNLYLAFINFRGAKHPIDYLSVFSFLEAAVEFRRYSSKELELLTNMIRTDEIISSNHDPDAFALKTFAAWLIYDNSRRYPSKIGSRKAKEETDSETQYNSNNIHVKKIWIGYLQRKKHVQRALRIEKIISPQNLLEWGLFQAVPSFKQDKIELSLDYLDSVPENRSFVEPFPTFRTRSGGKMEFYFSNLLKLALSNEKQEREQVKEFLEDLGMENSIGQLAYCLILRAALDSRSSNDRENELAQEIITKYITIPQKTYYGDAKDAKKRKKHLKSLLKDLKKYAKSINIEMPRWRDTKGFFNLKSFESTSPLASPYQPDYQYSPVLNFDEFNQIYETCFEEVTPQLPLEADFKSSVQKDEFFKNALDELQQDYLEGIKKNAFEQQVNFKLINPENTSSAKNQVIEYLNQQEVLLQEQSQANQVQFEQLKQTLLSKVNEKLLEPLSLLKIKGMRRKILDLDDCIGLFLQGDREKIKALLKNDNEKQISEIYNLIGNYLELSSKENHLQSILSALNKLRLMDSEEQTFQLAIIANLLKKQCKIGHSKNPAALLVFENKLNISLYEHQIDGINELLPEPGQPFDYPDVFLHRIQGAGKSLVFGHILAYLKADGYHLSIHVTPHYQYATVLYDMKKYSSFIFNQKERALYFDDNPAYFSEEYLDHLLEMLTTAINDREFIHTTNESLRSLRCKYIKTSLEYYHNLSLSKDQKKLLKVKIKKLQAIISLIRAKGILTFEEVHDAMDSRKVLNMPYGPSQSPNHEQVSLICKVIQLAILAKEEQSSLLKIGENKQAQQTPEDYKKLIQLVAEQFLEDSEWRKALGISDHHLEEVKEYLLNPDQPLPSFITLPVFPRTSKKLTSADHLLLLKQLLSGEWLRNSFKKSVFEHHGIDPSSILKISIPFLANNKPSTGSQFSDRFVLIINTLIAYLVEGLTDQQTKEFIAFLKEQSSLEFLQKKEDDENFPYEETFHCRKFKALSNEIGISIEMMFLNPNDKGTVKKIREGLKTLSLPAVELLFDFVAKKILNEVPLYDLEISSNGQNTASMGKSISGYSGSLDNKMIAPVLDVSGRKTKVVPEVGTNGQTLDLLVNKFRKICIIKNNPESIFEDCLAKLPIEQLTKVRALIDIGCHFKGRSNYDAALMIHDFLEGLEKKENEKSPLSHIRVILFFDESSGKLSFIYRGHPKIVKFLSGTTAEEIADKTLCEPNERFTFYGNGEITGQNILQADDAIALYTLSESTSLHKMIQGQRRMRGLNRHQKIIGLIQNSTLPVMADALRNKSLLNYSEGFIEEKDFIVNCILFTHLNEAEAIYHDNLTLCLSKMTNLIEQFLFDGIYSKRWSHAEVFKQCGQIFLKNTYLDLVQEYGLEKKSISAVDFLEGIREAFLKKLEPLHLKEEELKRIGETLKMIADEAVSSIVPTLKVTENYAESSLEKDPDGTMVQEVSEEKENIQENLNEMQEENEESNQSYDDPYEEVDLTVETLMHSDFGMAAKASLDINKDSISEDADFDDDIVSYSHESQRQLALISQLPLSDYMKLSEMPDQFTPSWFEKKQNGPIFANWLRSLINNNPSMDPEHKSTLQHCIEFFDVSDAKVNHEIFNLQDLLEVNGILDSKIFDPSILLTKNFVKTEDHQWNLVDPLRKTPHHILLICDENMNKSWKVVCCSLRESESVAKSFENPNFALPPNRKMWLLRLNGELAWTSPSQYSRKEVFTDPDLRRIWVQTLFFSGNLKILQKKAWLIEMKKWLKTMSVIDRDHAKIFFEQSVLRNRLTVDYLSGPLYKLLSKGKE